MLHRAKNSRLFSILISVKIPLAAIFGLFNKEEHQSVEKMLSLQHTKPSCCGCFYRQICESRYIHVCTVSEEAERLKHMGLEGRDTSDASAVLQRPCSFVLVALPWFDFGFRILFVLVVVEI